MEIKKGDKLTVKCARRGIYNAVATADFDTEADDTYSVAVDQAQPVCGKSTVWEKGDDVPCSRGIAIVTRRV